MTIDCSCGRPINDQALVCRTCWSYVERGIGEAPALLQEIETTRTRQNRTGGSNGGRKSAETPLPWLEAAATASNVLTSALTTWAQYVADDLAIPTDYHQHPQEAARFLLTRSTYLRHAEAAPQARASLNSAVNQAQNVIDLGPELLYAGPCDVTGEWHQGDDWAEELRGPCRTDLYARADKAEVECPRCTLAWNVVGRREYLLESAEEQLVTAPVLSRFLTAYGEPLTSERIRQWASRGQLARHGTNTAGDPLYKVAEAIAVLSRMNERKAAS